MTRAASPNPAGLVMKYIVTAAGIILAAYLVWALGSLILPVSVGALLAYICRPLVARLERLGVAALGQGLDGLGHLALSVSALAGSRRVASPGGGRKIATGPRGPPVIIESLPLAFR